CASIGASSSSSGSIIAPNASKCTKTYSDCGTSCSSLGGQSNKPGEGCNYSSLAVNGSPCYYNITAITCSSITYPYDSSNLPLHSDPVAPFCTPGRSDCVKEDDKQRYTDFKCVDGYHKNGGSCDENDCPYMNSSYVNDPSTPYSCQYRESYNVNNGAKTITCYSSTVYNDECNLECDDYTGRYNNKPDGKTCSYGNFTNDIGETIKCYYNCQNACTPACPTGWSSTSPTKSYDCQTVQSESKSDGCGGTITCYKLSNDTCKLDCEDFGYYSSALGDGYSCSAISVTDDFGDDMSCYNCAAKSDECECTGSMNSSGTSYYNTPVTRSCTNNRTLTCYTHVAPLEGGGFPDSFEFDCYGIWIDGAPWCL
ncbi:MAG: hypothetical protein IJ870_00450, partial [Alphaproteobacteria bacterium]|nr:hypothetical protein [Alphaproteobacteria bacterium]